MGYIQHSLGYEFSWESVSPLLMYPFWYGLVFWGVLFSWFLAADLLALIFWLGFKVDPPQFKTMHANLLLGLAGVVALYVGARMVWDTHRIETEEIIYNLDDPNLKGFTIVHISDLQADRYTSRAKMERYMNKINAAEPDMVIFTGDLITEGPDYIIAGAEAIGRTESEYGVYAVIGDHDYWAGEENVVEELENQDVIVLQDENQWIEHNGSTIKLTGVTEIYNQKIDPTKLQNLLNEDREESLSILMTHQATDKIIHSTHDSGYHQLLAGHTHGGQIKVPFFFYHLSGARRDTPYVQGTWWMNNMLFNINSGLGFTLAPVRYNAPANVSVITIR